MFNNLEVYSIDQFSYINPELSKHSSGSIKKSPIKKTAIMIGKNFNVYIDCSDGIRDSLPIKEYCGRIYKLLELFGRKKFFYFKMNYSPDKSENIVNLVKENNGEFFQSYPWSYYGYFKAKINLTGENDLIFFGNISDYAYPKPYLGSSKGFNCEISWQDAELFFNKNIPEEEKTYFIPHPTRQELIKILVDAGINLKYGSSIKKREYLEELKNSKANLCLPGIGEIPHKLYEDIYLGLPSFYFKSSYVLPFDLNKVAFVIDFKDTGNLASKFNKFLDYKNLKEISDNCREIFENYMTPKAIVNHILKIVTL